MLTLVFYLKFAKVANKNIWSGSSMKNRLFLKFGGFIALLFVNAAFAVTTSVGSLTVASGSAQSVKISRVTGKVSVTNSAPGVVIVSKGDSSTYKVTGITAGAAKITFKDSKSSVSVNVTVTANSAAVLTGRLLASNCFQCHGTNGVGGFEKLAGQSVSETYGELKKFSTGAEDPNGIMAAHAMGFSDAQLNAIATYFSSQR